MRKSGRLSIAIVIGIVLGMAAGLVVHHMVTVSLDEKAAAKLATVVDAVAGGIGGTFLLLLKMIIVPLVFSSLVVGMVSAGDIRKSGKLGGKTLIYYMVTTGISVLIGMVLVNLIQPGKGLALSSEKAPDIVTGQGDVLYVFKTMIPANPIEALATGKILSIIFVALFFGAVLTTIGKKGRPLVEFFDSLNAVMLKATGWIMYTAPLGVLGLTMGLFAKSGFDVVGPVVKYFSTVTAGLAIHAIIILPLMLLIFARVNPWKFGAGMMPSLLTAFSTSSSSATLPLTMECAEDNNGISNRVASFVLPLGATINMDGTALYEAVAAMTIAQAYGMQMGLGAQVTIFLTATLAAVGAAGIPSAGLVTMGIVLKAVGLPLDGIVIILAVDRLLDMMRTTVNVWGDSVGAGIIEAWEGGGSPSAAVERTTF